MLTWFPHLNNAKWGSKELANPAKQERQRTSDWSWGLVPSNQWVFGALCTRTALTLFGGHSLHLQRRPFESWKAFRKSLNLREFLENLGDLRTHPNSIREQHNNMDGCPRITHAYIYTTNVKSLFTSWHGTLSKTGIFGHKTLPSILFI